MCGAQMDKFPLVFDTLADEAVFFEKNGIKAASVPELEKGLDEQDLKRAVQRRLFRRLTTTAVYKGIVFLTAYKKGLERLLSQ